MPIAIQGITPLLEIFDMPKSIAFYRDVLGFQVVETSEPGDCFTWAMLKLGNAILMLNTAYDGGQRPASPDARRVAGHADTELFCGCPDVAAAYSYLLSKGIAVKEPETTHYGMKQLLVTDPDGFKICLHSPSIQTA